MAPIQHIVFRCFLIEFNGLVELFKRVRGTAALEISTPKLISEEANLTSKDNCLFQLFDRRIEVWILLVKKALCLLPQLVYLSAGTSQCVVFVPTVLIDEHVISFADSLMALLILLWRMFSHFLIECLLDLRFRGIFRDVEYLIMVLVESHWTLISLSRRKTGTHRRVVEERIGILVSN